MITLLKLGGELLEDMAAMQAAAAGIARLRDSGPLVVVHGGGRAIDADLKARGKTPHFVDGLRVTDKDTLDTVVGVLAGRINTAFVGALAAAGVKAVGLTGADASLGLSSLAPALQTTTGDTADLGHVGVPQPGAPATLITDLLALGYVPVVASIGVSAAGDLLNVNADVLAAHLASAIGATRLIIGGKTPGVFDESGRTCERLDERTVRQMVARGAARDGMVAKLGACLDAIAAGVSEVRIIDGRAGEYAQAPGTVLC
ncbi:MAG TPA: acetylglutamate kinase [Vicinamibacterales bacterium]|nr:acetylglutamate kinase [Vicinamibacterales bacterium]